MTRHAILVLLALLVMLVATCRSRSHSASGGAGSTAYVPYVGVRGRCDYRRDPYDCFALTATVRASWPTPEPTRASATWAPSPYEPLGRVWLPITADVRGPGRVCSGAWAGVGVAYIAAHCLPSNPLLLRVDGALVTAWQADRSGRDLAQVVTGVGGGAPSLAILTAGDALTLRPARGDVPATYAGDGWGDSNGAGYMVLTDPYPGARPLGVACADPFARVLIGDSGGGAYRVEGGGLGGIVVAAEAEPGDMDAWCGAGQSVVLERVP